MNLRESRYSLMLPTKLIFSCFIDELLQMRDLLSEDVKKEVDALVERLKKLSLIQAIKLLNNLGIKL